MTITTADLIEWFKNKLAHPSVRILGHLYIRDVYSATVEKLKQADAMAEALETVLGYVPNAEFMANDDLNKAHKALADYRGL